MPGTVVDSLDFRNAVARFASGVTIVSTRDAAGHPAGMTATAFSSLSLEPPLVLVCIQKTSTSYDAFMVATYVGISILAEGQGDLAWHFSKRDIDKFAGIDTFDGDATGMPLLPGATVHIEGRVYDKPDGGDHTIFLVEVMRAQINNEAPLLHFNRKMGRFVPDDI